MGKDDGFKVTIPKLRIETNFSEWKETLSSVLGSKQLRHYIQYDVKKPTWIDVEGDESRITNASVTYQVPTPLVSSLQHAPREFVTLINEAETVTVFHEDSKKLPDSLIHLALHCVAIVIVDGALYPLYTDLEEFKKARSEQVKEKEKVRSVIRSSIGFEHVHLFKHENVFLGFQVVVAQFGKDLQLERINIKRRLGKLKCRVLKDYINEFRRLLVELDHAGGKRESEEVLTVFLKNIPNSKYLTYKTLFTGTTVDEAFSHFKTIADKEENFRKSEEAPSRETTRVRRVRKVKTSSQKDKVVARKVTIAKRCTMCGGFGHKAQDCVNTLAVCHRCGSDTHFKKNCTLKKVFIEVVDSERDNHESSAESTAESVHFDTDSCTEGCLAELEVEERFVHTRTVVLARHLRTVSDCICRFKDKCLQLIIDNGASQTITGKRSL